MRIHMWTDGSVGGQRGVGGWGAVVVVGQHAKILGGFSVNATSIQMEIEAVRGGLGVLTGGEDVCVYTDSSYVIEGIVRSRAGLYVAQYPEIWSDITNKIRSGRHQIYAKHVRSHSGEPMNEIADAVADFCRRTRQPLDQPWEHLAALQQQHARGRRR